MLQKLWRNHSEKQVKRVASKVIFIAFSCFQFLCPDTAKSRGYFTELVIIAVHSFLTPFVILSYLQEETVVSKYSCLVILALVPTPSRPLGARNFSQSSHLRTSSLNLKLNQGLTNIQRHFELPLSSTRQRVLDPCPQTFRPQLPLPE